MDKKTKIKYIIYLCSITFLINAVFILPAAASITDGTIDSAYKYAWSENTGWLNFGAAEGNVHITDSVLTGYIWGENMGWISLNCSNDSSCGAVDYKVSNDNEGNLSGYAWSENTGWINFNPPYGGVSIDSNGSFSGYAWGENIGWIVFNCSTTNSCETVSYKVKTDWRPQSSRPIEGGGLPATAYNPPTPPPITSEAPEGFSSLINKDAEYTNSRIVTLTLNGGSDAERMALSNNPDFSGPGTGQISFESPYIWDICYQQKECLDGTYTVYVEFYNRWGRSSEIVSDSITYKKEIVFPEEEKPIAQLPPPEVKPPVEKPKKPFIEKVPKILKPLVPEFLKPKPPEVAPEEIPIEELVQKEAPLAFQGKWRLLPSKPIREFVLAPLPKEIRALAKKFPELGKTLKRVGITKITDIKKLKTVKLTLPGLTERVGLPTAEIQPGKFALPKSVPVAKLSSEIKQKLPTEIVFAKTAGELIDFNIALAIGRKGEVRQKITVISGKPLQLVVKPDKPVKSIKGYVVFRSKRISRINTNLGTNNANSSEISGSFVNIRDLTASLFFAKPVFAQFQDKPVRVEEKLVLLEFEYTDPDGDGIYTAEIQAPLVEGEYEIITVMDFEDPELGKKEIRLITVVDPEGYIYEKVGGKETRIPGAIVSIYWLNSETKQYELWPAKEYQQENSQITNTTGKYSFLVPEGNYYLKVEAPGYLMYDGKPFQVKEGSGVHINIALKTKYWQLKVVDWKTILLIVVIILLLYNFYRDKLREKLLKSKKL